MEIIKEDLEKYYVDEKKSMAEISRIYGCCYLTIKHKLEKYGISIRSNGSFLVDDDGNSLYSKYIKDKMSYIEYQNELSKNNGYKNWNEYNKKMSYNRGDCLPMSENKDCPKYLGVYIAEKILPLLFENVERMPDGNPGFDFICDKGYKVDNKSACLGKSDTWIFHIYENNVADYFFMIAFDDRESLNVMHMWLVKGDTVIEKTKNNNSKEFIFNKKDIVSIGKGNRALKRWIKYEITDIYKLEKIQKICDKFKSDNILN